MRLILVLITLAALLLWFFVRGERADELPERGRPTATAPVAYDVDELAAEPPAHERTALGVGLEPSVTPRLLRPDDPMALLRVRVVDVASRQPIAGVNVTFRTLGTAPAASPGGRPDDQVVDVGLTGGDGIAVQMIPPGVRWEVAVAPEYGRAARIRSEPLAAGEEHDVLFEVVTAPDFVLHGRVLARDTDAPIANAVVRIEPKHDVVAVASDGTFRAEMRSWRDQGLEVRAPGYGPRWVARAPGHEMPERALTIVLDRGASLRIAVLDSSGAPASRLTAEIGVLRKLMTPDPAQTDTSRGRSTWERTTDSDGVAEWTDLPAGVPLDGVIRRYSVLLHEEAEPIVLDPGEQRALTWRLTAMSEVRGIVLDNGVPVPDQAVWLQPSNGEREPILSAVQGGERRRAKSDANGRFRFDHVTPGSWWIGPAEPEFGHRDPARDPIALGQLVEVPSVTTTAEVELHLQHGLVIRGRIVAPDDGPVVRGHVIAIRKGVAQRVSTNTAADGTFTLGPLLPGAWLVSAGDAHPQHLGTERIEVEAGATNVIIQLRSAAELSVRVVAANGGPVPSVVVHVTPERWYGLQAETDASGLARVSRIPLGTVAVGCTLPDGRWALVGGVHVGLEAANEVELVLEAGARGTIRLADGANPAELSIVRDGATIGYAQLELGTPAAVTLPAGRVVLRLWAKGKVPLDHEVTIAAGTTPEFTFDGAWR